MQKKKINWKVRFKNRVWLTSFISLIVGFIFNLLKLFDVYPPFTENTIMSIAGQFLTRPRKVCLTVSARLVMKNPGVMNAQTETQRNIWRTLRAKSNAQRKYL